MLLLPYAPPYVAPAIPPAFDAIGAGSNFLTWSHTAAAGAYVLSFLVNPSGSGLTGMTYGGTAMGLLGSSQDVSASTAFVYLFGLAGVPGGPQTVAAVGSSSPGGGNSLSYTHVSSVGTPQNYQSPSTTTFSQSVTCAANQIIVQSFEDYNDGLITSSSGGTFRYDDGPTGFTIREATANTTFTATLSGAGKGAGIAVVLS
jgi:hypothetical protein